MELALARLYRFYPGIDPFALPEWLLAILHKAIEPLRAEEAQLLIMATSAPHMKKDAYRQLNSRLERLAKPLPTITHEPERPKPKEEKIHDPELAADFFRRMGARVVEKKK